VEGSVLDGRYRLDRLLGTGGMGDVWLAEDTRLGRWVALKWLRDDSPGGLGRELEREARLVARLQHANIVAVYDVSRADGRPYLVMEYVHGLSLRELIEERGGKLSEAESVRYGAQIAEALAYAHEQGIYHSDVKPENVLVSEDGQAKAVDFGIAQTVNRTLAPEEARGVLGTIAYLAPEVIQGQPPDAASDIYSLAIAVFEMVAGRLPFMGVNPAVVASQRLAVAPPPLRSVAPDASASLESVLAKALALDPAQRWPSARDFARALRQTRQGRQSAAAVPVPPPHRPQPQLRSGAQARPVRPPTARHPVQGGGSRAGMWAAVIMAGLLAVAAGVVAALLVGANDDDDDNASDTPTPGPTETLPAETPATQTSDDPTETPTEESTETPTPTLTEAATETPTPSPTPATPTPTPTLPSGVQTPGATPTQVEGD
jgi:serine/threonine-protein kinase